VGLATFLFLYLLPGAGVAAALRRHPGSAFVVLAVLVFWPLFVPLLLGGPPAPTDDVPASPTSSRTQGPVPPPA
jgi:hypothetical protein